MKDPQVRNLRDAEAIAMGYERALTCMEDVRRFAGRVARSRWWAEQGGPSLVEVFYEFKLDYAQAVKTGDYGDLWLPRWAWNEPTVLHELAHLVVWRGQNHGPTYAGRRLEIEEEFGSKRGAKRLRAEFERRGVRVR